MADVLVYSTLLVKLLFVGHEVLKGVVLSCIVSPLCVTTLVYVRLT